MLVLSIIGIIVGLFFVYGIVIYVNEYTLKKYDYEYFDLVTYGISAAGYVLIFYGNSWYQSALVEDKDILNGILVMGIGVALILAVIYKNFKHTPAKLSIFVTPLQQLLYAVFAVFGFLAVIFAIGYFAQTKPVFDIGRKW
ncbi:MAG: hypothetical protein JW682_00510 [Campylobacterales bacterium]|nr:hypothetical protein [Campylobacterales bacterium]